MMASTKFSRLLTRLHRNGPVTYQRYCLSKLTASGNVNKYTERSHTCGGLTQADVGKRVQINGWVKYTRFDNKIIALRDSYGTVQCIVDKNQLSKSFRKTAIHNESVLKVSGLVQARPSGQRNEYQTCGDIEVLVDNVEIVSDARKDLPILTRQVDPEQSLPNRLRYRYLDIRGQSMQGALRFRSKVCQILRQSLHDLGFVECETPTLFRRTPGGANEFIVPTQLSGSFYGLTQSPQQLKQLLMIGGLDRYFQISRCYRDESGRSDRQPEFTQLDIELSFTSQEHIMNMIDELMSSLCESLQQETEVSMKLGNIFKGEKSIERMTYENAFRRYGTDKPDTRFEWLLEDDGKGAITFTVPHQVDGALIVECLDELKSAGKVNISEFDGVTSNSSDGVTTIAIQQQTDEARNVMGQLRLKVADKLQQEGHQIYKSRFKFLWVTGFPLFTRKDESEDLESNHHPFTAPTEETAKYLATEPLRVVGQHYDLVLNGQEIAGGSMRIHRPELQRFIFNNILKLDESTFAYFIEALSSGCPPHGGIAIGLDRFIAILLGKESIRDVIAFPKSSSGRDLMSDCPHTIDEETLKMYHIKSVMD